MFTGSFGSASNQDDWSEDIALLNDDNSVFNATGARIFMRLCREGNSAAQVLGAQTDDGTITISSDGSSISWTIPQATMSQLRPDVYNIFVRMQINGLWTTLISATETIIDGGPAS